MYSVIVAFINLFTFNGDFDFGKSQWLQGDKSGLQEIDKPGSCDALPK
jgi:hypothetical protein